MCALFRSERLALKYFKRLRLFLPVVADHANTTGLAIVSAKPRYFSRRHSCRPAFSFLLNIHCLPILDLLGDRQLIEEGLVCGDGFSFRPEVQWLRLWSRNVFQDRWRAFALHAPRSF